MFWFGKCDAHALCFLLKFFICLLLAPAGNVTSGCWSVRQSPLIGFNKCPRAGDNNNDSDRQHLLSSFWALYTNALPSPRHPGRLTPPTSSHSSRKPSLAILFWTVTTRFPIPPSIFLQSTYLILPMTYFIYLNSICPHGQGSLFTLFWLAQCLSVRFSVTPVNLELSLSPFARWEKWGPERLRHGSTHSGERV